MEKILLVDIDGTIMNCDHRMHFITGPKKDWDGYFSAIKDDTPIQETMDLLISLKYCGYKLIFITGRPENSRQITKQQLDVFIKNNPFAQNPCKDEDLFMRPEKCYLANSLLKEKWYDEHFSDKNVLGVFDDNPAVIKMFNAKGITTYQCSSHRQH